MLLQVLDQLLVLAQSKLKRVVAPQKFGPLLDSQVPVRPYKLVRA